MAMYDNKEIFNKSWDYNYLSEELIQAQWAEFVELKKVITTLYKKNKKPLAILDIGIGSARIPQHLCRIPEMWTMIDSYDGTDNAQDCVILATQTAKDLKITNKLKIYSIDATHLDKWANKYDLILITWFTAGNFYPKNFPFKSYRPTVEPYDLSNNKKFELIFKNLYNLLKEEGEIVLGACYVDNDATRQKQERSYAKMGITIITDKNDSFTATKEGFWSQRFTKDKIFKYLHFIKPEKITFKPLDTYNYAMQVRIKK